MPSISVPTAIALASAAATAGSAYMTSTAAKSAAKTQAGAATNAVQLQQHMFDTIQQNLNPYMQLGSSAMPMIQGLLGVGGGMGTGGPSGPQVFPTADGSSGGAPAAPAGPSPGMLAAQAAGPHSKNPLTSGVGGVVSGLGGPLGAAGPLPQLLGFGKKNASPLQDIAAAMAKGLPISDASWAKAGYGPGGAASAAGGKPASPWGNGPFGGAFGRGDPGTPAGGPPGAPGGPGPGPGNPMGATPFDPQSFLEKTPGYQFIKNQGLQATQNSYASHGLSESGAALKGAANYAEGLASTTYEQRLQDYFQLLGGGQNAAMGLGGFGTQAGLNMGNTAMSGAAATAAGTVGSANAISGGITGVANAGALYKTLQGSGMFDVKPPAAPAADPWANLSAGQSAWQ